MARKLRIEYPGAVYHVMSRGNQGNLIYRTDADRKLFLDTLGEGCEKTGWQVHAYVLMGNHYHMLLETPEANLVAGMKWLQGTYTQRFNAKHKIFGHLFQGRYKSLIVDGRGDDYLQVVSTYIHLNPARAQRIRVGQEPLKNYQWSSYPLYLQRPPSRPAWLRTDRVLGELGIPRDDARGRKGYEAYVEGRVLELVKRKGRKELEEEWRAIRRGWYLGETDFRRRLEDYLEGLMKGKARQSFSGEARRLHDEVAAEALVVKGLTAFGLGDEDLCVMPKGAPEKQVLAWWLRKRTVASRVWIARRLRMGDESRVTQAAGIVQRSKDRKRRAWRRQLERLDS